MAKGAVLGNRRVLPEVWAAFFGMTLVTGIVQCLTNQLRFGCCPMRAVTTSAIHLTFEKRMRKRFQCFVALQLMAVVTDLGLRRGLQHGIARRMADVAIGAGNLIVVMRPTMPTEADVCIVAIKTHVILDTNPGFLMRAKLDHWRAFLAAP